MTPIEVFQRQYGAQWYLLVNSEMWRQAKIALLLSGPAANIVAVPAQDITAHGAVYAANLQGYSEAIRVMEELLVVPDVAPFDPANSEANYQSEGAEEEESAATREPQPTQPKPRPRKPSRKK